MSLLEIIAFYGLFVKEKPPALSSVFQAIARAVFGASDWLVVYQKKRRSQLRRFFCGKGALTAWAAR
jgi:hypothetical protein